MRRTILAILILVPALAHAQPRTTEEARAKEGFKLLWYTGFITAEASRCNLDKKTIADAAKHAATAALTFLDDSRLHQAMPMLQDGERHGARVPLQPGEPACASVVASLAGLLRVKARSP